MLFLVGYSQGLDTYMRSICGALRSVAFRMIPPYFYFHLRKVETTVHPYPVTDQERGENFAQLISRLKDTYGVSESEIARRLDVSTATVNNWAHGRRQTPRVATLDKLAELFPKISRAEIFAAAGRRTPGQLTPDAEQRIMENLRELTEEQQRMFDVQIRAVAEGNRSGSS